jgi:hypothetical protein
MAVPLLALGAIARLATLTTWKRRRTFLASALPGLGGWRCALPEPSAWCRRLWRNRRCLVRVRRLQ